MNGPAPHASDPRTTGETCRFQLDVRRGKTQFRARPIHVERFLVGSGTECHLRLGDTELPAVHCVIHAEAAGAWLEAIARNPRPLVNGLPVDASPLHDGDEISIGGFHFVLHDLAPNVAAECEPDVSELSAAELVDLLESDVDLVEEYESGIREGEAMLHAALASRRHADELTELVARLESYADELDRRSARLAERERLVADAAAELHGMHRELERRVSTLETRTREQRPEPGRRAA